MRDFRTMTPSSRRSTAMSRGSHSILRKAGFSSTAAAFPLILRLPKYRSVLGLLSSLDIDRLSLFEKGPDAFAEFFQAAAQDLIAVFHRDHRLDRPGIDGHVRSHEALLTVVPANAGTHNHGPLLLRTTSAILASRNIPRYGSPLSRGDDDRVWLRQRNMPYRGAMRMAPSRRMVSPFSIGFSTMWTARLPYSLASPSRAGCGTWAPRLLRASSLRPISSGVRNRPGAIVLTRIFWLARSRAAGRVKPTTPPFDAE